jgi:chromosome segregation ATPase
MALTDSLLELFRTAGGGAGTAGGIIAFNVYKRFSKAEDAAKAAKKLADAIELKVTTLATDLTSFKGSITSEVASLKSFTSNELDGLKRSIAAVVRGSQSDLAIVPDQKTLERITTLESRISSLEDDFDASRAEDRKSWEEIQRALGRIEGRIGSSRPGRD